MKTLWFKGCYVEPILSGTKHQTYRDPKAAKRFTVGETIAASVGPRPAFALLRVDAVDIIPFDRLPLEEQRDAAATYPGCDSQVRIRFHRVTA